VGEVRASRELPTDATDATDTAGLLTTKLMVPVPRWQPVARQRLPLSEREQVVLRHLSSRLSAGEIADELYVSVNTVKTHIKSIYRKLDTNRRWDAVKRARQLRLL
jgi:LuxR family transcriptional regulator, maltose regulon positive regulatory protein